jgi:hypothetical protein
LNPWACSPILYQTEDGRTRIQCRFEDQSIWLTEKLIDELFQVSVKTINEHLVNICDEAELGTGPTIRKFRIIEVAGRNLAESSIGIVSDWRKCHKLPTKKELQRTRRRSRRNYSTLSNSSIRRHPPNPTRLRTLRPRRHLAVGQSARQEKAEETGYAINQAQKKTALPYRQGGGVFRPSVIPLNR